MTTIIENLYNFFAVHPLIAIFISIACGHIIGKFKIGNFQLGGLIGTLICAMIIGQFGVVVDPVVKRFVFAIFLYAVGYASGPQFFNSIGKHAVKDILLAIFIAITSLATVLICAKIFHMNKGLAAGVAAGGLTQSGIIGTASSSILQLNLPFEKSTLLLQNMADSFAVTYIIGLITSIFLCVNGVEFIFRKSIHSDALMKQAEVIIQNSTKDMNSSGTRQPYAAIAFKVTTAAYKTIEQVESSLGNFLTIEKLKRGDKFILTTPELKLVAGDLVMVFGRLDAVLKCKEYIGKEVTRPPEDLELNLVTRKIVLTKKEFLPVSLKNLRVSKSSRMFRGVCLLSITRNQKQLNLASPDTMLETDDIIEVYGNEDEINRIASIGGYLKLQSSKTDFIGFGFGIAVGILLGTVTIHIMHIPVSIGSSGPLISGLIFSWINMKKHEVAYISPTIVQFIQDFGLAAFIATVGLSAGHGAIQSLMQNGIDVILSGFAISVIPLILAIYFGKFILKYDNVSIFAGALSGARSANTAFCDVLERSGNAIPTTAYTVAYTLSTVILTLLGPLIISLT